MFRALLSYLKALLLSPVYAAVNAVEFFHVVVRYYPNTKFRRADLRCIWAYALHDPYLICQRHVRDMPEDRVQKIYGETFLTSLETFANAAKLTDRDVVYDLGCGRGRSIFWLNAIYKCRAIGVDITPKFVIEARRIKERLGIDGVEFILANVLDLDYQDATVIYLYGTAFSDEAVEKLIDRFRSLKPGTRIVTVSYALTEYTDEPLFELEREMKGKYLWGEAGVFIHRKL